MLGRLWELFVGFGRATMLGYGGGPSIIPLYENEAVNNFNWMTTEQFGEALAIGNALPGPIATKLAAYVGFKVAGWLGAAVALAAVVLPTALLMIGLVAILVKMRDNPYVQGMISGVKPVVFVMLAMLAYDFAGSAFKPSEGAIGFIPFLIAAGFFIMVQYLQLNAAWGVAAALVVGALFLR